MSSVFLRSYRYGVSATGALDAPVRRLLSPEPGLTYRSTGNSAVITADLGSVKNLDSVALIGAKLEATDSIHVQASLNADMSAPLADLTVSAYTGLPRDNGAICTVLLAAPVSARYIGISIQTARPIVEVSRLLIGQRIEIDGIDSGPELTPTSGSAVDNGFGWTTTQSTRTRLSWKATAGNIKPSELWNRWLPFLNGVGLHEDWLFLPDSDSAALQQQAVLVRQQNDAKITEVTSDRYKVELSLLEV